MIKSFHLSEANKEALITKIRQLDCSATRWVCDVRQKQSKRSNPQNDRMWQFFTDLADYLGYERSEVEELKLMVTMEVWPVWKDLPSGERWKCPPKTSKMNTKEHTEMMDACERYVANWGFIWRAHD